MRCADRCHTSRPPTVPGIVRTGLFGVVLTWSLVVGQADAGQSENAGAGPEVRLRKGVQLLVKFAKSTFALDESIVCTVSLTNTSDRDKSLPVADPLSLYRFRVMLPAGREAPITLGGKSILFRGGSVASRTLKPGESYCFTVNRLNELYDMSLPEEYVVSVSTRVDKDGGGFDTVTSNEARIKVEAPSGYGVLTGSDEPYLPPAIEGMDETRMLAVLERLKQERSDLEKDLLRRLRDAKLRAERLERENGPADWRAVQAKHAVCGLICTLGLYRMEGAAKDLSDMIELKALPLGKLEPPWGRYPAVDTLIRIGRPAVPLMLENIGSSDSKLIRELSARVLLGIEGAENSTAILEKALQSQTDKRKQESLQEALRVVSENKQ